MDVDKGYEVFGTYKRFLSAKIKIIFHPKRVPRTPKKAF